MFSDELKIKIYTAQMRAQMEPKSHGDWSQVFVTCISHFCHFSSGQKGHVNRSRGQIYRQIAGQFSTVAGSYSSRSSKTLMLLVSHFTSSGQRAKLTVLGYVPSLPFVCYLLLNSLLQMCPSITFFCLSISFLIIMTFQIISSQFSLHPFCPCFSPYHAWPHPNLSNEVIMCGTQILKALLWSSACQQSYSNEMTLSM